MASNRQGFIKRHLLFLRGVALFFLFTIIQNNFLVGQVNTFHKVYSAPNNAGFLPWGNHLVQTDDQHYLFGGARTLVKVDSLGNLVWRREIINPSNNSNNGISLIYKRNNNSYILGGWNLIMDIDTLDNINNIYRLETNTNQSIFSQTALKSVNTNIFLGFITQRLNSNLEIPGILKLDSVGSIEWAKVYIAMKNVSAVPSIAPTSDGGLLAVGTSVGSYLNSSNSYHDCIVYRLDSLGSLLWSKSYTSLLSVHYGNCMKPTPDGNFIITGTRNLHPYLMKINENGDVLWKKWYVGGVIGQSMYVSNTIDNGFVFTGTIEDVDSGGLFHTVSLYETDSIGNLQWARELSGFTGQWGRQVIQTDDGGYAIYANWGSAIDIIKTDSLGQTNSCPDDIISVTVSNVQDTVINISMIDSVINIIKTPITMTFPLTGTVVDYCSLFSELPDIAEIPFTIHPNPADYAVTISYFIPPNIKEATILIYDLGGRLIEKMELDIYAREHTIDISSLDSGSYQMVLQPAGMNRVVRKLVVVR